MTTPTDSKALCPICRKPAEQKFRPFCSSRCRDIDLGRWFSESYAIPVSPDPDDAETLQSDEDDR